ncbi:MAG: SRPBCC family protein [Nocardioidaceae bacterium]
MSNRTGTHILGRLWEADGTGVVRIEDRYGTSIEDLWSAITDPKRIGRWYGAVEGDLRPGGTYRVRIEPADLDGTGRIEECDPPRRLVVSSRETEQSARKGGDEPFDQTIEATLAPDGDQTILVIEVRGLPLQKLAAYGAGWQMHAEALASYLAGQEPGEDGARWAELMPLYAAMMPRPAEE